MPGVSIITDSTAYLPKQYIEQYDIDVIPLTLLWEGKSYRDGVDITATELYTRLKTAATLPTTSQATANDYTTHVQKALDKGNSVLILPISSGISASYQSALAALRDFEGKPVELLDTKLTSMALGFMVLAAARAAKRGASLAECKAIALKAYEHIGVYFTVESLRYLHKGGRIGGAKRLFGSVLQIKPILKLQDGKIDAAESVTTRKKAIERMVELVKKDVNGRKPVRISVFHALETELATELQERLNREMDVEEGILAEISPAVGAHVGTGTIAIAWMAGM
jgi:DegV family protein with EDD domain